MTFVTVNNSTVNNSVFGSGEDFLRKMILAKKRDDYKLEKR